MKARLTLTLALLLCCGAAFAQPNYELADQYSAKKVGAMVHSLRVDPHWFSNSDRFWYRWETSEGAQYYIVDAARGTRTAVFDMEKLAMQLSEIVKDPFDAQHIPFQKFRLRDDSKFTFEIKSSLMVEKKDKKKKEEAVKEGAEADKEKKDKKPEKPEKPKKENKIFRFEYDIASNTLKDVTEEDEVKDYPRWANISPDGTRALYTKNYDLYWMSIDDVKKLMEDKKDSTVVEHRLTEDATAEFYYGGSNYRAATVKDTTERMSTTARWSPGGKYFAIEKFDMRPVKELWVIKSTAQPRPTLQTYKYQMPGEPGPVDYLCLFDIEAGTQRTIDVSAWKDQSIDILNKPYLKKELNDDYLKSIWLGDNEKFFIQRTSRDLKRVDICVVGVNDTVAKPVIEERLNTYVETQPLRLLENGDMLWWSERNGWANLYLYGADGTLKNTVAEGPFHVDAILSVDEKARAVYFLAMGVDKTENPYNGHVYRVGLDGKGMKRLDEAGYNSTVPVFCDDSRYFVNTYSRVDCAPMATVFDANGKKVCALDTADFSQLLAAGYKFPEPFKVKAADGITDLYGYMYKPYDFDSTKTYPIIDYVYPGPQVEGNSEAWSSGFTRKDRLAQIGFIVVTVGNRGGHPNRSKWYHNYGYGNLRDYGLEDQKYAIQQLAARYPFIDITRVGIHGHSGGGFMSTAAILKYPDFFKAAVSCAGNHDNSMYNRWWSEQHHGILEEITAKGDTTFRYSIDKNQSLAKNLKGHLLLVHGDVDDNVHPGNTIRVVDALIRANKRFEMLILPGQKHGFGDMNEYFFWRMADWYSEWLLGSSRRDQVDIRELNND